MHRKVILRSFLRSTMRVKNIFCISLTQPPTAILSPFLRSSYGLKIVFSYLPN